MFDLDLGFCVNGSYSGIGSRRIAVWYTKQQMRFGAAMALMGVKLNSGGADGSDTAYEFGAKVAYDFIANKYGLPAMDYSRVMSIYLPWNGFNGRNEGSGYTAKIHPGSEAIAAKHHGFWSDLGYGPRKMMSRNSMQVLGEDLDTFVRFVMCHTSDGAFTAESTTSKTGGTGQAIRIAGSKGINVYNTGNQEHYKMVENWLCEIERKIENQFGVNVTELIEQSYQSHMPFKKKATGDAVQMLLDGDANVLIHGCNCQNAMGSGIAKQIKKVFPEAYQADMATRKGDKRKLGTFSDATVEKNGRKIRIINAYTQYRYGRNQTELYADYEAVRKSMGLISDTVTGQDKIVVPSIGAGLANGCWVTLSNSIANAFSKQDLTYVEFSNDRELSLEVDSQHSLF